MAPDMFMIAFAPFVVITHHTFTVHNIDQAVFETVRRSWHRLTHLPNHKLDEASGKGFFVI